MTIVKFGVAILVFASVNLTAGATDVVLPQREKPVQATDIFASHSWYQAPPRRIKPNKSEAVVPRIPKAPPLPYSLLGTFLEEGNEKLYFLVKNGIVRDVKIGDVLDEKYSVLREADEKLVFRYIPLQVDQWLSIGE